jgi:hemolysin III
VAPQRILYGMDHDAVTAGRQSRGEEIANSLTHGLGAILAVAGLVVLALSASRYGTARAVVGCVVFGVALVLLYSSSTLYHSIGQGHARAKAVLRVLDHSAIFLLIAGTYTPFTLVSLRGPWGWSLFGVVWGLALAGIALRLVLPRRPTVLFVSLYLAMGWCVVVAAKPLLAAVAPGGIALLAAGGLAYSVGVVFYVSKRPYHHAIWHVFVLAGSAFHYAAVLRYVALA